MLKSYKIILRLAALVTLMMVGIFIFRSVELYVMTLLVGFPVSAMMSYYARLFTKLYDTPCDICGDENCEVYYMKLSGEIWCEDCLRDAESSAEETSRD